MPINSFPISRQCSNPAPPITNLLINHLKYWSLPKTIKSLLIKQPPILPSMQIQKKQRNSLPNCRIQTNSKRLTNWIKSRIYLWIKILTCPIKVKLCGKVSIHIHTWCTLTNTHLITCYQFSLSICYIE
jgi:hypothetical protein